MKYYYAKFYAQVKVRERETLKTLESNNDSDENTDYDEDDESSAEVIIDNRFVFVREVPNEDPVPNQHVS